VFGDVQSEVARQIFEQLLFPEASDQHVDPALQHTAPQDCDAGQQALPMHW